MKIFDRPGAEMTGESVVLVGEALVVLFVATQTDSGFFRILLGILGILSLIIAFACGKSK